MFKSLLKGTFILTITGLITRIIGFIYKIYLSNILGAKMLGIYQLVFPVFSICFTIFGAGIQTAISQMIATKKDDISFQKKVLIRSLALSTALSFLLFFVVYISADSIAYNLLGESDCADALRILVWAFPVCGIAACINGCYYGMQKATVPAMTQLIEQIARVVFVYTVAIIFSGNNVKMMCLIAVAGIGVGEGISMIYSMIMIIRYFVKNKPNEKTYTPKITSSLVKISTPLTANRLVVALLHSVETILIPIMLKKYGMDSDQALSVYGVLTGMAIPFIMFPSTITNSLSVLLLPTISEANANNNGVRRISRVCLLSSVLLGVASTAMFLLFGADLGSFVFHNESVGLFIEILSFLCPFLFAATTLTSIINGLGQTHITFIITVVGLAIRIFITIQTVPVQGISGYLISLLVSQLVVTALSYRYYRKLLHRIENPKPLQN